MLSVYFHLGTGVAGGGAPSGGGDPLRLFAADKSNTIGHSGIPLSEGTFSFMDIPRTLPLDTTGLA